MSFSISANMRSFPLTSQLSATGNGKPAQAQPKSIADEFLEIARKSPLERMRDKIMEDMKLSDESLASMDSESRQAVEDEIKRRMMEALGASTDTGQLIDKSA